MEKFWILWDMELPQMESPYYCLKSRIPSPFKKDEIQLFSQKNGLSTLLTISRFSHSTKYKIIQFNPAYAF